MRGRRLIFICMLAIFLVIGISLGSASALDFVDYEDTWYKTKFKLKGVCEEEDSLELSKESAKDTAWIYIQSYDGVDEEFVGSLISMDEDGVWQETPIILSIDLGTPDDAVLELESEITITDGSTGDVVEILSFFVRLTGKENKDGELRQSTKLRSVAGAATVDDIDEGFCITSLEFSGKLKKEEKVPDEVKDLVIVQPFF